ncbi:MAG TPA: DR2241 family protein [Chthoniobacteraceae bacterium]|jgi:sirohydrochlorin cobaltochelatase|nr:DR2241 family protein [Chthoniobacteraceae bacterium]
MSRNLTGALADWLAGGARQMGEVLIRKTGAGYDLRHAADAERDDLPIADPREVALANEAGAYRPLKTAPDLRRGWRVAASTVHEVRHALDLLYPAMLGVLLDYHRAQLSPVPLRETLTRQSGMYAVTKKLTDDQAQTLIHDVCRSDGGCLKSILWPISGAVPVTGLPAAKFDPAVHQCPRAVAPPLPMLCHEACNLLVARAREVVKEAQG